MRRFGSRPAARYQVVRLVGNQDLGDPNAFVLWETNRLANALDVAEHCRARGANAWIHEAARGWLLS